MYTLCLVLVIVSSVALYICALCLVVLAYCLVVGPAWLALTFVFALKTWNWLPCKPKKFRELPLLEKDIEAQMPLQGSGAEIQLSVGAVSCEMIDSSVDDLEQRQVASTR